MGLTKWVGVGVMRAGPIIMALLIATPLHADGFAPAPKPPRAEFSTPATFFAGNKTCLSATDGCRSCARKAGGRLACSTAAFACVPKSWTCTEDEP